MAEKRPSPPLTGIAKVVGESPDVSFEEKVIQRNYQKLVNDLDVKSSVDLFFGSELITSDTMERIDNATTRKDANRVLIKDLLKGISPNRFSKFTSLLWESADEYKRPRHKTLADKLEGDLKTAHESEPSPSQLTTNEAQVTANPSPFLPPQFPPTGSPAARGPPSQPLLGPPPGMPLPMAPQAPGTFPPGMGVPPGFGSQPMSVSQPFWGIPPTSTVSLAPSVSTEQDLICPGREGKDTQTPAEEMQRQRNHSDQVSDALAVWGSKQKEGTIGIAFVLTNGDEKDKDHLAGVLQDNHRWCEALTKLNFDLRSEHNVREKRMKKYLDAVAKVKLLPECKFVVFVYSGHGAEGILYSCDDKPIALSEYFPNFFKGELGRINKLFFFDACRDGSEGRYFTLDEALFESKPKESTGGYLAFCAVPINAEADDDPKGSQFSTIVTKLIVKDLSLAYVHDELCKKLHLQPTLLACLTGGLSAASVNLRKLADLIEHTDESEPSPSQLKTNEAKVEGPLDSPHIHRLRDHLYKRYKRLKVEEGGKKMEFVRLAVLKGQVNVPKDEEEIRDKLAFLRRFRNCGEEERQIAGYIDAFDLLRKSSGNIRVVYGQPGIGKTTLLTHVCRALAMKEADSEYALVLYFPLRDKKVSGAKTLSELLSYYTSDNKKIDLSEVEQSLVDSEEKQMLLILDGADEVREMLSIPDSSVIQKILTGTTLPQADVVVSSRPGSLPLLQRPSSSFYEIHGFDQASIDRYIKDFFNGTPEKAEKMMKELHSRPDLLGGAHIPMNLFIYCSIYDYGKLPPSITECHKKFLYNVVKREYEKCGVSCQVDSSLSQMSPEVKGLFESLGALAYEGMMKNPPVFVFDESDIRRAFPTLPSEAVVEESMFKGLLVQHSCRVGYEEVNTFNFSHTTNHEFFVAWHISHLPKADQLQFVREHFSNPKFAIVVRFYSGLTGLSTPGVAPLLCQSVSARSTSSVSSPATSLSLPSECSNDDPSLLYLFHSLYESQNLELTQKIVQHLNQSLEFDLFLTCHDTLAIAYCLGKCAHLKELSFSVVVDFPPSSLPHMLTIVEANSHLLSLKLTLKHLSSTDATALISGMAVEKLDIGVGETTLSALSAIFHSRTVKELILKISSLSKDHDSGKDKQNPSDSVSENTTLRKLVLDGPSDFMTAVLHGVAASATIEDLKVQGPLSPDGGEHDVAEALAKCVVYTKLRRVEMEDLPPLPVMKGLTTRKVQLEELVIQYPHQEEDGEDLKEVERTTDKIRVVRLVLRGSLAFMTAVLHGVAASATIEDLEVRGHRDSGVHDVAEALAKCVVNPKLRRVEIWFLPTLPVMKGLTTREVPLEELVIQYPRWWEVPEDHLKEMERSAAKIRVRKIFLNVVNDPAMCDAVSSGLGENKCLQEVALFYVPEEKKQFVRSKLSSVKTLTVN